MLTAVFPKIAKIRLDGLGVEGNDWEAGKPAFPWHQTERVFKLPTSAPNISARRRNRMAWLASPGSELLPLLLALAK